MHESTLPKLAFLICQFHFAKLQSWHCPILNQTSPCLNSQLYFAFLPDFQVLFFYFAKLPSPVQPVDCRNKLQAVHKLIFFADIQGLNFVSGLLKCLPQKPRLPLFFCYFFSTGYPRIPPFSLPSLSLHCFFTWWVFEVSPFQNSNYPLNYFLNILRANWKVLTSNFRFLFVIQLCEWCRFEAILGDGIPSMKIHEFSGWNTEIQSIIDFFQFVLFR